jgi:hypothetical protein
MGYRGERMSKMRAASRAGIVAVAGLALAAAVAGCVSYASYPPVEKDVALNDPNIPAMEEVMMAGLRWVGDKHTDPLAAAPAEGATPARYAVNLPKGVKPKTYRRVATSLGAGAQPLTPETSHLPIYHVDSIRVRGDQANVWIYRPAPDMGLTPQGLPVYQEVKLWLRGGLGPWRVVNAIERTPGAGEVPELNYYAPEPPAEIKSSAPPAQPYKPAPTPAAPPAATQPQTQPAPVVPTGPAPTGEVPK